MKTGQTQTQYADLAYRSGRLEQTLAEAGILLASERARRRPGLRQHIEIAFSTLKRISVSERRWLQSLWDSPSGSPRR